MTLLQASALEAPPDDVGLVLHDLAVELRRVGQLHVETALKVAVLQIAGHKRSEIREQLGLTALEYGVMESWLREAMSAQAA